MVRYCCVCKIESGANEDTSIHIIPKSKDLKEKWFRNIGRKVGKFSGVCSKHFEAKDIQYKVVGDTIKRFLVPGSIPTLLLTQHNCENILNDVEATSSSETLLSAKNYSETSVLLSSHHQLQANKDNSSTILADVTNINVQDCVEIANYNDVRQKTALKRKSNEPIKDGKRFNAPRYVGDLRRTDFTSDTSWKIVQKFVKTSRSQCKVLNQKVKRLDKKVKSLKSLLHHLKKNGLLSSEVSNILEVSDKI